ncbi:AAA family ATPase [Dactylosporangium sp. CA-233914]|uniref:AAA family ATPase n=1 Tax=Dactylosporangium sp. CA-233914 TaxID=3239934 RepID=UPI003D9203C0
MSGARRFDHVHNVSSQFTGNLALAAFGRIAQDQFRRVVLREHGGLGHEAVAPGFIGMSARYLLNAGYHVIVECILDTRSYSTVLRQLIAEHSGPSHVYYLDVSFKETIRRHRNRAEPIPVSAEEMRSWYVPLDALGVSGEHVIPESSPPEQTVDTILDTSGLVGTAPTAPCPTRCARCEQKRADGGSATPATAGRHDGLAGEEAA